VLWSTGIVADWRTRYGRKPDLQDDTGLSPLNVQASRTCGNGEPVLYDMGNAASAPAPAAAGASASAPGAIPAQPGQGGSFVKGSSAVGLRDIGASAAAPSP
jgi:hypothetical protein